MMSEFKHLSREFWGRHIWGRGYFVASSDNVTDEVIMQYIELQGKEPEDGDFRIDGELQWAYSPSIKQSPSGGSS